MALEHFKDVVRFFILSDVEKYQFFERSGQKLKCGPIEYHNIAQQLEIVSEFESEAGLSSKYVHFFERNLISLALDRLLYPAIGSLIASDDESEEVEELLSDLLTIGGLINKGVVSTMLLHRLPETMFFYGGDESKELALLSKYCRKIVDTGGWSEAIFTEETELLDSWLIEEGTFSYPESASK